MSNTEEVLVIGAGPVGLVAACQLACLGVHVRVIDALPQRTTQSRAVGIQARSLEMLASLGVASDHAPDPVGLRRADGTAVSIEELLLAHPGLLLLVRSADSDAIRELRNTLRDLGRVVRIVGTAAAEPGEPADWVVDTDDAIGKRYGLGSDGLALIRPDGYLGLVASPADPGVLRRHLRDALGVVELSAV